MRVASTLLTAKWNSFRLTPWSASGKTRRASGKKCLQNGNASSPACKKVLGSPQQLLQLREECKKKKNQDKQVCKQINQPISLPGGGGGLPTSLPTGLPRSGVGPTTSWSADGPTLGQLMKYYDPALVSLLVPGMVVR